MDAETRAALEAEIRRKFDAGDLDAAMTAAVAGYGNELYGFLVGLIADPDRASDVFGATCERMWKGLPAFRWQSSFRVWAYSIARNEFMRAGRRHGSRAKRQVPLEDVPSVRLAMDQVRTTTPVFKRTDVREALDRVREKLAPEDHMLLGLRIDRRMSWNDIAEILGSGDPETRVRDAATLRKKFERLKEKLRAIVRKG